MEVQSDGKNEKDLEVRRGRGGEREERGGGRQRVLEELTPLGENPGKCS